MSILLSSWYPKNIAKNNKRVFNHINNKEKKDGEWNTDKRQGWLPNRINTLPHFLIKVMIANVGERQEGSGEQGQGNRNNNRGGNEAYIA